MVDPIPSPVRRCAVLGFDHHRTPIAVRERLALPAGGAQELARTIAGLSDGEAVVLSTCNRMECVSGGAERGAVIRAVAECCGLDPVQLDEFAFWHEDVACARHLFRVTSGLESLVLGEYQIAHQVKTAYEAARAAGLTGSRLNPLFQRALAAGKEVRNRTAIGQHKLSVASVAVDLAKQVHGDLAAARLLVVGAGEIAELAVRYLADAGVKTITLINRSEDRALSLAESVTGFKPAVLPWGRLGEALVEHDIVVSSTAAPHAVLTAADVRAASRRRREPQVFIDLALPRDIEPAVADITDVFLYNLDHLDAVVAANRRLRHEEVAEADALVDELVTAFQHDTAAARAVLMTQVATFFTDVVDAEEQRLKAKLGVTDSGELRYGLERVGNKLQHRVLAYLRTHANDPQAERMVRDLLGL
jgi:glutamyl-tRNA reductase